MGAVFRAEAFVFLFVVCTRSLFYCVSNTFCILGIADKEAVKAERAKMKLERERRKRKATQLKTRVAVKQPGEIHITLGR